MVKSYIFAGIAPKFLALITVSLVINILDSRDYVNFDYILVTSSIVFPVVSICLVDAYYHFQLKDKSVDIYGNISGTVNAIHYLFLVITYILYKLESLEVNWVYICIFSFLLFRLYLCKMDARVRGDEKKYVLIEILPPLLTFAFCIFLKYLNVIALEFYLFAYCLSWGASSFILTRKNTYFTAAFKLDKEQLKFSLPFVPNAVLVIGMLNLFRYFSFGHEVEVVYSLNYRLLTFYIIANSIFFMIFQDYFYKRKPEFLKYVVISSLVSFLGTVTLYLLVYLVMEIYLGSKYYLVNFDIYNISVIAMFFYMLSSSLSVVLNYKNKSGQNLISNVTAALVAGTTVCLWPENEKVFAVATLVAFLTTFIYRIILAKHLNKEVKVEIT